MSVFFFRNVFYFYFCYFSFFFPDRWKTREICQKRIRRNTAVFMTSYIILIKLNEVQFGRNITWPRDLKIGRARSARSITNKYDCKQNFGCHEAQLPLYDSHLGIVNSVSTNILLIILHIFLYAKPK